MTPPTDATATGLKEAIAACPNPWCSSHRGGSEVAPYVHGYTGGYCRVRCVTCPQIGPNGKTPAEAITAWNTRTAPPARTYAEGVAALHDAVEVLQHVPNEGNDFDISVSTTIERCLAAIRLLSQGEKA